MSLNLLFFYENDEYGNLIHKQLTCIYLDYEKAFAEFTKLDLSYKKRNPDSDDYYALEFWKTVDDVDCKKV